MRNLKMLSYGSVLLFLGTFCSIFSCTNRVSYEKTWEEMEDSINRVKEQNMQIYADSVVNLSFYGIELGSRFKNTISKIRKNKDFHNVKIEGSNCLAKVSIALPNEVEPLLVDVKVCSYEDTITSFLITSNNYDTRDKLMALYKDKYGEDYASDESGVDDWGDKVYRSGHNSYLWTFKNQSIRLSNFYREKRENYIKNPEMRSPQNRYGIKYTTYFDMVTIIYSDIHQCNKVDAAQNREYLKKLKEQQFQDSINAVHEKHIKAESTHKAFSEI